MKAETPMASSAWNLCLLMLVAVSLTDAATKLCDDGWDHNGAFCYYFSDPSDTLDTHESTHACQMQDAQFAWPQTKSEFDYLRKKAQAGNAYAWHINVAFILFKNATAYFDVDTNDYKQHPFDFLPEVADNFDPDEICVAYNLQRDWLGYAKDEHWYETVRCSAFLRSACVGKKSDLKDQVIDQDKWFENGDNVYWVKAQLTSYKEAKSECESRSMALLDDPSDLYDALGDKTFDATPFWSSVTLKDGNPYWSNGKDATPPAFRWTNPRESDLGEYLILSSGKIRTRDLYGRDALPYVCKKRAAYKEQLGCPSMWKRGGRSCYLVGVKDLSWQKAKTVCESRGAHLLTVDSKTEAMWLRSSVLDSYQHTWTSANDLASEGTFVWHNGKKTNGKIFPWSDGNVGAFKKQCAMLNLWYSQFETLECTAAAQAACQYTTNKGESCTAGWHLYKNTCYWFDTDDSYLSLSVHKKMIKMQCLKTVDGIEPNRIHLLEVRSDDVMKFIQTKVAQGTFWLGLERPTIGGDFLWPDGTVYNGDYFDDSIEPNNGGKDSDSPENCASIDGYGYGHDEACDMNNMFICEKELPEELEVSAQNAAPDSGMSSLYFALLMAGLLWCFLQTGMP